MDETQDFTTQFFEATAPTQVQIDIRSIKISPPAPQLKQRYTKWSDLFRDCSTAPTFYGEDIDAQAGQKYGEEVLSEDQPLSFGVQRFPFRVTNEDYDLAALIDPERRGNPAAVLGEWMPYLCQSILDPELIEKINCWPRVRDRFLNLVRRFKTLERRYPNHSHPDSFIHIRPARVRHRTWEFDDVAAFPAVCERNGELIKKLRQKIRSKREYISCNKAAQLVFEKRDIPASKKQMARERAKAKISLDTYSPPEVIRTHPLLSEFIFAEQPILVIGGQLVMTFQDCASLSLWSELPPALRDKIRRAFKYRVLGLFRDAQRELSREFHTLEGNAPPSLGTLHHEVSMSTPSPPEVAQFVQAVTAAAAPAVAEAVTPTLVQLAAFAFSMANANSFMQACGALLQFAAGNAMIYSKISTLIARVSAQAPNVRLEGAGDGESTWYQSLPMNVTLEGFQSMTYAAPILSAIGIALAAVLSGALAKELVPMIFPSLSDVAKGVKFGLVKELGATVGKYILECVVEMAKRIHSCVKERSLLPLWGRKWDPNYYAFEVESMMTYMTTMTSSPGTPLAADALEKLRVAKRVPDHWVVPVSVEEFYNRGEALYEHGTELRDAFKGTAVFAALTRLRERFRDFLTGLYTAGRMTETRVCPFMFLLHGPPGSGKTTLSRYITSALGRRCRYTSPSEGIYDWQMKANFQDGLNHTHWGIHMDDIDQSAAPPTAGFSNHVEVVLSVVDNRPMPVEQALAPMKGHIRANPLIVGYTTNFSDCNLRGNCMEPNAFWRRVKMRAMIMAKPEFQLTRGNGQLDTAKASACGHYDVWDIYVSDYQPLKAPELPWGEPRKVSLKAFLADLNRRFDAHLKAELKQLVSTVGTSGFCPECNWAVGDRVCPCGAPGVQNPKYEPPRPLDLDEAQEEDDVPESTIKLEASVAETWQKTREVAGGAWELVSGLARDLFNAGRLYPRFWWGSLRESFQGLQEWTSGKREDLTLFAQRQRKAIEDFIAAAVMPRIRELLILSAVVVGVLVTASFLLRRHVRLEARDMMSSGIAPMSWLRAEQVYTPGLPIADPTSTFTYDEMLSATTQSVFRVLAKKDGQLYFLMYVTMLNSEVGLTCGHLAALSGGTVIIDFPNNPIEVVLDENHWIAVPSNKELYMIVVRAGRLVPGVLGKLPLNVDASVQQFDEVQFYHPDGLRASTRNQTMYLEGARVLSANYPSEKGCCGLPVFARFHQSWKVVGIHYGNRGDFLSNTLVAMVMRRELDAVAVSRGQRLHAAGAIASSFQKRAPPECDEYPVKSEVLVAMTHHGARVHAYGELQPQVPGGKMKTKIRSSIVRPHFEEFCARLTGDPDYWSLPEFRGWMGDKGWTSPFTDAFTTQSETNFDEDLMWFCVADYLRGAHLLDTSGYGTMSEAQAISGIPGSYVHSINLRTSAGPPYQEPKSKHYSTQDEVGFSPEMAKVIDEVERLVAAGIAPVPHGKCSLKDECVKPGKLPRIFTNLPSGYNIALKRRVGAICAWMRANMEFFEMAVGINISSQEASKIIAFLRAVDPSLTHLYDGDARRLDKSWSGQWWSFVKLVWWALAFILGIASTEVELFLEGMKYTLFSIKGDVFVRFWNPSGVDITVQLNGIVESLGERYTFYKNFFKTRRFPKEWVDAYRARFYTDPRVHSTDLPEDFVFRLFVAFMTYGDDNVKATLRPVPSDYEQVWKDELGIEVTDAAKLPTITKKTIAEVTFLKRNFVWDEELGRYICPLSLKSIARMLLFSGDSKLGDKDHAAVSMSEALREMVLHGRGPYEELLALCTKAATAECLLENAYLQLQPYDFWRDQMRAGVFQTWQDRSNLPFRNVDPSDVTYENAFERLRPEPLVIPPPLEVDETPEVVVPEGLDIHYQRLRYVKADVRDVARFRLVTGTTVWQSMRYHKTRSVRLQVKFVGADFQRCKFLGPRMRDWLVWEDNLRACLREARSSVFPYGLMPRLEGESLNNPRRRPRADAAEAITWAFVQREQSPIQAYPGRIKFILFALLCALALALSLRKVHISSPIKNQMSQITTGKSGSDPVQNTEAVQPTTQVSYEIGELTSDSQLVTNVANETLVRHQTFPETTLGDFLTRPVEIASYTLKATDLVGASTALLPWNLFLANAAVAAKTSTFAYVQGRLQLMFDVAIPGNAFGSYVLSAVPSGGSTIAPSDQCAIFGLANAMQVDHWVRIDCANSENLILELPWVWPYDVADLSQVGSMWELYLTCLSPLQTAIPSGVSQGQIRVYAALVPGYDLSVPHFEGNFTPTAHTAKMAPGAHKKMVAQIASHPTMVAAHAKIKAVSGGRAEGVAGTIESIANKMSAVPVIGPYAATAAKVASKAKALFHHFGFTRESAELTPITMMEKSVTNVARVDGIDRSDVAVLTGVGEISIDPSLVGALSEDQASLASFVSRWTVIKNFEWASTATTGTALAQFGVSPYVGLGTGSTFLLTAAGYYGAPFEYWRSDMEYMLILPVSKLHRGTVQVVWNNSTDANVPLAVTNRALNLIIDVAAGGDHTFTVGFAQDRPFLPSQFVNQDTAILPLGTFNGVVTLQVVNPLSSQNAAAKVYGTILARSKPNPQFALPRTSILNPGVGNVRDMLAPWYYEGASGDEEGHEATPHVLVSESGPYPAGELLFPAETLAPRALMQKPSRLLPEVADEDGPEARQPVYVIDHFIHNPFEGVDALPVSYPTVYRLAIRQFTWASHFAVCFTGIAASTRWKMIAAEDAWCGAAPTVSRLHGGSYNLPSISTLAPMTFVGSNRGAEFLVPYDIPAKYVRNWDNKWWLDAYLDGRKDVLFCQKADGTAATVAFYYSLGPDIRCAPFRLIPRLTMWGNGTNWYPSTDIAGAAMFSEMVCPPEE